MSLDPGKEATLLRIAALLGVRDFAHLASSVPATREVGRLRYWQEQLLKRVTDELGMGVATVDDFAVLFGEAQQVRLTMSQSEFLADPVFHFYKNRNVDIPSEWIGLAWDEARFRKTVSSELVQSVRTAGDFDSAYPTLARLAQALSPAQAKSLYEQVRDEAQRPESEWRPDFVQLFPSAVAALPTARSVDDARLRILTIGEGSGFAELHNALSDIQAVTSISHAEDCHHGFGHIGDDNINTVIIDPFSVHSVDAAVAGIFRVRFESPEIVFVLFVDPEELERRGDELLGVQEQSSWVGSLTRMERESFRTERTRLMHYFRLAKGGTREAFAAHVQDIVCRCQVWHQARAEKMGARKAFKYDVALSFAGEDRPYADEIAETLRANGVRVFYDSYEQANLWGKDLFVHLHDVYSSKSRFCIILVSAAYSSRMWTVHERRAAQERALAERDSEYILPIQIDNASLPGLSRTIAYLDIRLGIPAICQLFLRKLIRAYGRSSQV